MNEMHLLQACLRQDRSAQFELVRCYGPRLLAVCRRIARLGQDPEDALQEAFIAIFRSLDRFDPDKGTLWAWMRRIALNAALKQARSAGRWTAIPLDESARESVPAESEFHRMDTEHIDRWIRQLPDGQRQVFVLVAVEGYDHESCAAMLGMAEGTSRSYLARARKALQISIHHPDMSRT